VKLHVNTVALLTAVVLFYRPDGYLYDKEAILENIIHQKKESTYKSCFLCCMCIHLLIFLLPTVQIVLHSPVLMVIWTSFSVCRCVAEKNLFLLSYVDAKKLKEFERQKRKNEVGV
jgi:hypothetical protein